MVTSLYFLDSRALTRSFSLRVSVCLCRAISLDDTSDSCLELSDLCAVGLETVGKRVTEIAMVEDELTVSTREQQQGSSSSLRRSV